MFLTFLYRDKKVGIMYFHLSYATNQLLSSELTEASKIRYFRIANDICPHTLLWIDIK